MEEDFERLRYAAELLTVDAAGKKAARFIVMGAVFFIVGALMLTIFFSSMDDPNMRSKLMPYSVALLIFGVFSFADLPAFIKRINKKAEIDAIDSNLLNRINELRDETEELIKSEAPNVLMLYTRDGKIIRKWGGQFMGNYLFLAQGIGIEFSDYSDSVIKETFLKDAFYDKDGNAKDYKLIKHNYSAYHVVYKNDLKIAPQKTWFSFTHLTFISITINKKKYREAWISQKSLEDIENWQTHYDHDGIK